MAIIEHHIKGHVYLYDHHRVGEKIRSDYLGRKDKIEFSSFISSNGFPVSSRGYKTAHKHTDKQERVEYGRKRFKELEDHIKTIPEGGLAGSHTKDGILRASIAVPNHLQGQVLRHEFIESRIMGNGKGYKTAYLSKQDKRIRSALKHKNVLGAGAEKRKKTLKSRQEFIKAVMMEYKRGTLHSSSGRIVTTRDQALAIAQSEASGSGY